MYLSRVQINPARRGGRKLLGSPQAMHAAVLSAFQQTGFDRGRVLWRVDTDAHHRWLYVCSEPVPDFAHIIEQAGWPTTQEGWAVRPYEPLLNRLKNGQRWAFRLTANPVRSSRATGWVKDKDGQGHFVYPERTPDNPRTKRHGHLTVDQQLQWLIAPRPVSVERPPLPPRAEEWGFRIPSTETGVSDVIIHDRRTERFQRQGKTVTISKATFDGKLEVIDANKLRAAMVNGMGPAKAYGCGLLTLAAIQ